MYRLSIGLMTLVILSLIFMSVSAVSSERSIERVEFRPHFNHFTLDKRKQIQCLAKNIYFEARGEPVEGQVAVAFVTLNRVESKEFPNTICEVVEQRRGRICQFSWLCESRPSYIYRNNLLTISDDPLYNEIRDLAVYVYANHDIMKDPTYGALFYHADYVNVRKIGVRNLHRTAVVGRHIFYVQRGL